MTEPLVQDLPVEEALPKMKELVDRGALVWVKFYCDHCGARQTSDQANTFHLQGYTCEECGKLTKPEKIGWVVLFSS